MSYCRFTPDSDAYLIGTTGGWECVDCRLEAERFVNESVFRSRELAIDHLEAHVRAGDKVPSYAFERLRREIQEIRDRHGLET